MAWRDRARRPGGWEPGHPLVSGLRHQSIRYLRQNRGLRNPPAPLLPAKYATGPAPGWVTTHRKSPAARRALIGAPGKALVFMQLFPFP